MRDANVDGVVTMQYSEFLHRKSQIGMQSGFEPLWMPDFLKPFQRSLVEWAVRKGRAAILADCGLGKGPMQLVWAENAVRHTNKPALIVTPLAVSYQMVREAEKFGIEAARSSDGKPMKNIAVTNYERLDKFDPSDYSAVSLDECFPPDTLVDTPSGRKPIKDVKAGDTIFNAAGEDYVVATRKKQINRAIRVFAGTSGFTCSENHLCLTVHGWRCAKDLRTGDYLVETETAMRLVRNDLSTGIRFSGFATLLRSILLSEMANEYAGTQSESSHHRNVPKSPCQAQGLATIYDARTTRNYSRKTSPSEPIRGRFDTREDFQTIARNWSLSQNTWRQRQASNRATEVAMGSFGSRMVAGIPRESRQKTCRLPDELQIGFSKQENENWDRIERTQTPFPQSTIHRPEESSNAGIIRVDRVEFLELGNPKLDCYRDENGDVYFYDIQAARHPSFSVNELLVHNCSIVKHWSGATQKAVTRFLSKIPYRLACTATPAPNDYIEMGTLSEALGELTHSDMLATFFRQISDDEKRKRATADDIIHSKRLSWRVIQSMGQWALKSHAFEPFWKWVSSWSRACRKPSDLGPFDDTEFVLPPLNRRDHIVVPRTPPEGYLFTIPAFGLNQERAERRRTLEERSELVAKLTEKSDSAVVWCQLNPEGDRLEKDIAGAVQVKGSQSTDEKEELILAFLSGQARVMVTKPKIAGLGLNMQHCAHVVTFVDHSFEKFYQCVRRCWRFGQQRPVTLDVIATEGEVNVKKNMERKEALSSQMFDSVIRFMNDVNTIKSAEATLETERPSWLAKVS